MNLIQRNDVIKQLSAATSDPPFRDSVLPWCLNACPHRLQTSALQKTDHFSIELCVSIEDHVAIRPSFWEYFTQLLEHPFRCGMASDVAVENATASMLDYEETVQLPEQQRRHCEQIESDDHLAMIPQESQPSLCAIFATMHAPELT
jgi:hypothetical protein